MSSAFAAVVFPEPLVPMNSQRSPAFTFTLEAEREITNGVGCLLGVNAYGCIFHRFPRKTGQYPEQMEVWISAFCRSTYLHSAFFALFFRDLRFHIKQDFPSKRLCEYPIA